MKRILWDLFKNPSNLGKVKKVMVKNLIIILLMNLTKILMTLWRMNIEEKELKKM